MCKLAIDKFIKVFAQYSNAFTHLSAS